MPRRYALGLLLLALPVLGMSAAARAESTPQSSDHGPFVGAGIYHQSGAPSCLDGQICWDETDQYGRLGVTLGAGSPVIGGAAGQSAFTGGGGLIVGGLTGAPSKATGTANTGAFSVLSAEPASTPVRYHLKIWNFAAPGGASLYCTDNGDTPSVTNASFIVYAQGGYERDAPGWVPSGAINCIAGSGTTGTYRAESYP